MNDLGCMNLRLVDFVGRDSEIVGKWCITSLKPDL